MTPEFKTFVAKKLEDALDKLVLPSIMYYSVFFVLIFVTSRILRLGT